MLQEVKDFRHLRLTANREEAVLLVGRTTVTPVERLLRAIPSSPSVQNNFNCTPIDEIDREPVL